MNAKSVLGVVCAAAMAGGLVSAQSAEPVDQSAIAKIRDEGLNRSQVGALFSMLADGIGPRLTGSPEHKRAADWARETMAGWGLSNPRLEAWEFGRGWTLDQFTIEMVEPRYMPLLGYAEAWSPSTPGEVIVPAVVRRRARPPTTLAAMPDRLKGAAVLQAAHRDELHRDRSRPAGPAARPDACACRGGPAGRGRRPTGRRGAHRRRRRPPGRRRRRRCTVRPGIGKAGAAVLHPAEPRHARHGVPGRRPRCTG